MNESFTDSVRRRIRERSGECPTCHQPTREGSIRGIADVIGMSHTTLWRFLRGGDITGRNLDKVIAWLEPQP
jgi:hypothetical protein